MGTVDPIAGREIWHTVTRVRRGKNGEITAEAVAGDDSPWFDGHFPGSPILPGIAQLAIIEEAVRRAGGDGGAISGVDRLRFKGMIRPGERMTVTARPANESGNRFSVRVSTDGGIVCTGTVRVGDED